MKKILVFLLLITGLVKSQVVIPKSTTTFSNILATGNLTVNGTARVTGASTLTGAVTTGTSVTVGGRMSAASLSVTAQTFSVGTTNYTAGTTGTIAVLSDAVFQFTGTGLTAAMGDASTYYFGNAPQTLQTSSVSPFYMPYNATLIGYVANFVVNGGASSAETGTLGINIAGTTTTLSTGITMNAGTGINTFTATGLSVNVNAGQMFCPYITTPTWVTNPGTTATGITFLFVRRQ